MLLRCKKKLYVIVYALHQPVLTLDNVVLMEDVSGQEKDVMESTTVETTLMKLTAVCLCLNTLVIQQEADVF